jgi:hypothetical protein
MLEKKSDMTDYSQVVRKPVFAQSCFSENTGIVAT